MQVIVTIGLPGSGKSGQSRFLTDSGYAVFSASDVLRSTFNGRSNFDGSAVSSQMDSGVLISDEVITSALFSRLESFFDSAHSQGGGIVLDGFPRTFVQAERLDRFLEGCDLSVTDALLFDIFEACSKERTMRRGRSDSSAHATESRLSVYRTHTPDLLSKYDNLGVLRIINAEQDVSSTYQQVIYALDPDGVGTRSRLIAE